MSEPTKTEVKRYIKNHGPVSSEEIREHFGATCQECASENDAAETIREHVSNLVDHHEVATTVDWQYE